MNNQLLISLTSGFSRVRNQRESASRFNGLPAVGKPFKQFFPLSVAGTGLKPGVNENASPFFSKLDH